MHSGDWPRPALTVDIAVCAGDLLLLIERAHEPFAGAWALPGGFVDAGEQVSVAVGRELREETGLDPTTLQPQLLGVYDTPGRDPRGWTVSVAYLALVDTPGEVHGGDDAAVARWCPRGRLPPLAFDHALIIADAFRRADATRMPAPRA